MKTVPKISIEIQKQSKWVAKKWNIKLIPFLKDMFLQNYILNITIKKKKNLFLTSYLTLRLAIISAID